MFHSFLNLFRSASHSSATANASNALTPNTKVVTHNDTNDFVTVDFKPLTYAEVAELLKESKNTAPFIPQPVKELERLTMQQPAIVRTARTEGEFVEYSDAIADDVYFNDKGNRSKKKKIQLNKRDKTSIKK